MSTTQHVMVSRLELQSVRHLPRFLRASSRIAAHAKASPGHLDSRLRADFRRLTFWTLSAWEDAPSMHAFVRTAPHVDAMRDLGRRNALRTGSFHSWEEPAGTSLPSWEDAADRLASSVSR
jgi:hypothetical protein